ncbi:GNAT family N-acetyltransferase [Vibrio agarivorans]|uniref:GNAT family N-acetyltransferase n=1 Tax=Vibrio agarivorans TaxID=153622 RepID=A0ABT7XW72_9VIBR|nr:GNAT family N-acetyltransferase [Vibrio agarivorans]MDN2480025.1 GNAT family N-acetyltransferase [Vibrio agarivorans]
MLDIEPLDPIKLPLVTRLYKQYYPSKPKRDELIIVGYVKKQLCAVVRFRTIEGYRLLTGMLIAPEQQGKGLGHQLLNYCQSEVLTEKDYCFAYAHLEAFYAQHGFETVATDELPGALKGLYLRYTGSGKKLVAMRWEVNEGEG